MVQIGDVSKRRAEFAVGADIFSSKGEVQSPDQKSGTGYALRKVDQLLDASQLEKEAPSATAVARRIQESPLALSAQKDSSKATAPVTPTW